MAANRTLTLLHLLLPNPNPRTTTTTTTIFRRSFSLWSMTKDPDLESALSRNRRWIVNNQIKNLLLRSPDRTSTVRSLQKRFKTLDLQGSAINWLNKYPCCFQTLTDPNGEPLFRFSSRMAALVDEEHSVLDQTEPLMAKRLAKLLMMSRDRKLNVVKLNELRKSFGFPDDYILRIVPSHPDTFRIVNSSGRRSSMEIELVEWDPDLAVSAVELAAIGKGEEPRFSCSLPDSWIKSREKFVEFNKNMPYISPYSNNLVGKELKFEKRAVGVLHELLSLTLWKKASIVKLEHFWKEFGLPEKVNRLLLRHPCIFYVSNRYMIYTVVLREGYKGSELVERDPMVVVKDKFGELMQEGLHEYNRRRCTMNLEKKRKKGEIATKVTREKEDEGEKAEQREERKRFYKVLFDENP